MRTRIKNLREDNDLTQKQLGDILNISQVAYSYYELGRRSIPLELLSQLADFYQTSVDYLLYRTDEIKPYPKHIHYIYRTYFISLTLYLYLCILCYYRNYLFFTRYHTF